MFDKFNWIRGVLITSAIYFAVIFCVVIIVQSVGSSSRKPISQSISNVKTFRHTDGAVDLKFDSETVVFTDAIDMSFTRQIFNVNTSEVYLLPHINMYPTNGIFSHKVIMPLPHNIAPGEYYYVRSFIHYPDFSMISKNVTHEPVLFRVCKERGECIVK